jgi:hypothetical protein
VCRQAERRIFGSNSYVPRLDHYLYKPDHGRCGVYGGCYGPDLSNRPSKALLKISDAYLGAICVCSADLLSYFLEQYPDMVNRPTCLHSMY